MVLFFFSLYYLYIYICTCVYMYVYIYMGIKLNDSPKIRWGRLPSRVQRVWRLWEFETVPGIESKRSVERGMGRGGTQLRAEALKRFDAIVIKTMEVESGAVSKSGVEAELGRIRSLALIASALPLLGTSSRPEELTATRGKQTRATNVQSALAIVSLRYTRVISLFFLPEWPPVRYSSSSKLNY